MSGGVAPLVLPPAQPAPRGRISLEVPAGVVFTDWTRAVVTRDLQDISGSFALDYFDARRAADALPNQPMAVPKSLLAIQARMPCRIAVDGEVVLIGSIEDVNLTVGHDGVRCSVTGRDLTGDLVDSSAAPEGPVEYARLDALAVSQRIAAPFGIPVRAEVDVGDPFNLFSVDAAETALSALEKAARQRALLLCSDGVGGLVLTRSGQRRGPAPLHFPGNVHALRARSNWRDRFSDYWVKGQQQATRTGRAAPLDHTAQPLTAGPAPPATHSPQGAALPAPERGNIVMTGHAVDPDMVWLYPDGTTRPRYRPRVWLARTQSRGSAASGRGGGAAAGGAGDSRARPLTNDPLPTRTTPTAGASGGGGSGGGRHHARHARQHAHGTHEARSSLQTEAEWRLRTARGRADSRTYVVVGWRGQAEAAPEAGANAPASGAAQPAQSARLWRPNELVQVDDHYTGRVGEDMLIAGVTYLDGEEGPRTELRVTGPEAYDLIEIDDGHGPRGRHRARRQGATEERTRWSR